MGGGSSSLSEIPEEEAFKGYLALRKKYEDMKDSGQPEEEIQNQVKLGFAAAFGPRPAVRRALALAPGELEEEAARFLKAATDREKRLGGGPKTQATDADYSKGFSGTKQDTQVEKEFEAMLRDGGGGDAAAEEETDPLLLPVECTPEEHRLLRARGRWQKYLGAGGCYLYGHSLTHEIVAVRPEDYEDLDALAEEREDPAMGLPSCLLTELPETLQKCLEEENKTPLFIDTSGEGKVAAFFSYKHSIVDIAVLSVGFAKTGVKVADLSEKVRQKLVLALKSGSTLAVNFGGITSAHGNFKKKICKKDGFPVEVFQKGGKKLYEPRTKPRYQSIFREEDMEGGDYGVKEGFRFVCVTNVGPGDVRKELEETLPLGYMKPIYVHT